MQEIGSLVRIDKNAVKNWFASETQKKEKGTGEIQMLKKYRVVESPTVVDHKKKPGIDFEPVISPEDFILQLIPSEMNLET